MRRIALLVLAALVVAGAWIALRAWRPQGVAALAPLDAVLARERAAAHFEQGDLAKARADLAALVALPEPTLEDLERAAAVEYMDRDERDPRPALERLRARDPDDPGLHYMLARMSLEAGDFEQAAEHYRAVLRRRPDDQASRVGLAATLSDLDRTDEARALLAEVVALGVEHAGPWYVQAVYRLSQLAQRTGPPEEAQRLTDLFQQLTDLGYRPANPKELDRGTLAGVAPARPGGIEGAQTGHVPRFAAEPAILPELAGARELAATDLDGDGDADFLAAGPQGVLAALRGADGYAVERVYAEPAEHVRALDLGNDDSLDLFACHGAELVLFEQRSGAELVLEPAGGGRWAR